VPHEVVTGGGFPRAHEEREPLEVFAGLEGEELTAADGRVRSQESGVGGQG
jgi:hypothetical protein